MPGRHIAFGDRDEARKPRFGGEQVVTVGIERAVVDPVADREELARRVEEKAEFHRVEHRLRELAERSRRAVERPGGARGSLESVDQPSTRASASFASVWVASSPGVAQGVQWPPRSGPGDPPELGLRRSAASLQAIDSRRRLASRR